MVIDEMTAAGGGFSCHEITKIHNVQSHRLKII